MLLSMRVVPQSVSFLEEIDARQDEVLRQLDELDERVRRVLEEYSPRTVPARAEAAVAAEPRP